MKLEKESGLEKLKKRHQMVNDACVYVILIGAVMAVGGLVICFGLTSFERETHLSDPNLPYTQYPENATFIWTHKQITNQIWAFVPLIVVGFGIFAIGGVVGVLNDDSIDYHKAYCAEITPEDAKARGWKYCPECRLKLERLEEKK